MFNAPFVFTPLLLWGVTHVLPLSPKICVCRGSPKVAPLILVAVFSVLDVCSPPCNIPETREWLQNTPKTCEISNPREGSPLLLTGWLKAPPHKGFFCGKNPPAVFPQTYFSLKYLRKKCSPQFLGNQYLVQSSVTVLNPY